MACTWRLTVCSGVEADTHPMDSFYEDLFPLVRFLPGYNVVRAPEDRFSAEKMAQAATTATNLADARGMRHQNQTLVASSPTSSAGTAYGLNRLTGRTDQIPFSPLTPVRSNGQPYLAPARLPPHNHWSDTFPFSLLPSAKRKRATRKKDKRSRADFERKRKELTAGGHSIPLEITMYMVRLLLLQGRVLWLMRWNSLLTSALYNFGMLVMKHHRVV